MLNPQKKIVVLCEWTKGWKDVDGRNFFFHFFLERSSSVCDFFGRNTFFPNSSRLQKSLGVENLKTWRNVCPTLCYQNCLSTIAKNDPPTHWAIEWIYAHLMHKTQQIHSKIELNTMQTTDLPKKLKSYVMEAFKLYKGMNAPPPSPLKRVGMSSPQPNGLDRRGAITLIIGLCPGVNHTPPLDRQSVHSTESFFFHSIYLGLPKVARANGKGLKNLSHDFHIVCTPKVRIVGSMDNDQNTIYLKWEILGTWRQATQLSRGCVMQDKPWDISIWGIFDLPRHALLHNKNKYGLANESFKLGMATFGWHQINKFIPDHIDASENWHENEPVWWFSMEMRTT